MCYITLPYRVTFVVTSRTDEKEVWLLVDSQLLRIDPRISWYIEFAARVLRAVIVYLCGDNKFHATQVSMPLLTTKFNRNYFVVQKYTSRRNACSTK